MHVSVKEYDQHGIQGAINQFEILLCSFPFVASAGFLTFVVQMRKNKGVRKLRSSFHISEIIIP